MFHFSGRRNGSIGQSAFCPILSKSTSDGFTFLDRKLSTFEKRRIDDRPIPGSLKVEERVRKVDAGRRPALPVDLRLESRPDRGHRRLQRRLARNRSRSERVRPQTENDGTGNATSVLITIPSFGGYLNEKGKQKRINFEVGKSDVLVSQL